MEEQPGNRKTYIVAACLSLLLVSIIIGVVIWGFMNSEPGYTMTKEEFPPASMADFNAKIEQMVLKYTVRHEGDIPIVHPPADSDIYLLASTEGWGAYILELEQGKPYQLKPASLDMTHTLAIRGLHLFNPISLGELATISFSPVASGRFTLQCGYICGPWHDSMNGSIIVVASPAAPL